MFSAKGQTCCRILMVELINLWAYLVTSITCYFIIKNKDFSFWIYETKMKKQLLIAIALAHHQVGVFHCPPITFYHTRSTFFNYPCFELNTMWLVEVKTKGGQKLRNIITAASVSMFLSLICVHWNLRITEELKKYWSIFINCAYISWIRLALYSLINNSKTTHLFYIIHY